jgi:uncharacterized protein
MALTYFNEPSLLGKQYVPNHYRTRKMGERILLTTDAGSWVILSKQEYTSLIRHELNDNLFKLLEEKGIILTERNIERVIWQHKNRLGYLFGGASLHIIIPTLRCNHKCIYCHSSAENVSSENKDMEKETAKKTLEFIFQSPAKSMTIEFQGGESLLNQELFKFIVDTANDMNKAHKKNLKFSVTTNLTLMSDGFLDWLTKEKVDISTSLDGPKQVHDRNRRYENGAGTYDDVTTALKKIKGKGTNLSALMVTTRYSLPYWKEIIDEYVKWGFDSIQIKPMNRLGFAEDTWKEVGYTAEEFADFWRKCADYIIALNKKGIRIKERYINIILHKILTIRDPSFLDLRSPCGIITGQLSYNYNGDIYSCDEGRNFEMFKVGNVKEDTYQNIILKEQSQQLIASSVTETLACDACAYKPFCGTCPVTNFAEQKNIIPKLATNARCKIMKNKFDYVFEKLVSEDKDIIIQSGLG